MDKESKKGIEYALDKLYDAITLALLVKSRVEQNEENCQDVNDAITLMTTAESMLAQFLD